ncbi:MAG: aldo/keto reductase [Olivibacter sp.]|nr:aldo/keto reductase [Olivibacter sp. UJ_SKK_5.1]
MVDINFLSRIGIGAYRMSLGNKKNHDAFSYAVDCGVNLVDTAFNYDFGQSEELIGYFTGLVYCIKVGYV